MSKRELRKIAREIREIKNILNKKAATSSDLTTDAKKFGWKIYKLSGNIETSDGMFLTCEKDGNYLEMYAFTDSVRGKHVFELTLRPSIGKVQRAELEYPRDSNPSGLVNYIFQDMEFEKRVVYSIDTIQ